MSFRLIPALLLALAAASAQGQESYPSQTIKLVVPFTPGSTSDITARAVAQKISGPLGQAVVVENRPGANGTIGMRAVANAKPDGYTLVVSSVSSTIVPMVLFKSPPFDLLRDFRPVSTIANTALVLTVREDSAFKSIDDLVAAAKKAPPGSFTYGNSAGLYLVAMEALNQQAGIQLLGVPYKGPADADNDLVGGRLSINPNSLGSATRMMQAGRTRALAVLSSERAEALPSVPTMLELGYEDFEFNGWIGILAPADTPQPIVQRLYDEIAKAVASEEIQQLFRNSYLQAVALAPEIFRNAMVQDLAKYERTARAAGIEKQ